MGFDQSDQAVFRETWCGEGRFVGEQLDRVMRNATNFAASILAAAYRVSAFDVRLEDTRRTLCAGPSLKAALC